MLSHGDLPGTGQWQARSLWKLKNPQLAWAFSLSWVVSASSQALREPLARQWRSAIFSCDYSGSGGHRFLGRAREHPKLSVPLASRWVRDAEPE